jgi:type III secretory pathway component EscR
MGKIYLAFVVVVVLLSHFVLALAMMSLHINGEG